MSNKMALLIIDMQRDFLDPEGYVARAGVDVSVLRAVIPQVRRLLLAARAAGIPTVDGLELLVGQGALSFESFTGRPASREAMRAAGRSAAGDS